MVLFIICYELKFKIGVIITTFTYYFGFVISLGAVIYAYSTEVLPPIGLSLGGIGKYLIAILIAKFSLDLKDNIGITPLFTIFSVFALLGFIYILMFAVETKDKTDYEIYIAFRDKKIFDKR